MIKINLLAIPKARKVKKASAVQLELVLGAGIIILVVLGCGYSWFSLSSIFDGLIAQKRKAEAELTVLKEKVKEVDNYEANKKILEEKNRIIERLKKNQKAPVLLLDQVSKSLEPLKIWLTALTAQGPTVDLDGNAVTNSDIVEFINSLLSSKMFSDIQLIESRQTIEANIPIYSFKLRCTLAT